MNTPRRFRTLCPHSTWRVRLTSAAASSLQAQARLAPVRTSSPLTTSCGLVRTTTTPVITPLITRTTPTQPRSPTSIRCGRFLRR
eukprot:8200917-Heterocapsa_arctica.AAC.1